MKKNDTLEIDITLLSAKKKKAQTLNLLIENIQTHQKWKYRYPLLKNNINIVLEVNSNIDEGTYAFNFLVQPSFFNVQGKIKSATDKVEAVSYLMTFRNKQSAADIIQLDADNNFSMGNILFEDSAFVVFAPANKKKNNQLDIDLSVAVDSAYTPAASFTGFVQVGNQPTADTLNYQFTNTKQFDSTGLLKEVIVTAAGNNVKAKFEKEFVTERFTGISSRDFDGFASEEIARSPGLFLFLQSHVSGIKAVNDESGDQILMWRNQPVMIYINEMEATDFAPNSINTDDIALIKIFNPGNFPGQNSNGVVAIYTKTGKYSNPQKGLRQFYLKGYTALVAEWK